MFGHHSGRKERKRQKQEAADKQAADLQASQVADKTKQAGEERKINKERGVSEAEEFLKRDVAGIDPEKRKAMQYEANKGIQRGMQSANRQLLGDQATHGVLGKGGVGYAQQRDLQKMGLESQSQAFRDLEKLDADLALKKIAAMFSAGQGEAAQSQLDKQMALDELNLMDEKKRHREYEDKFDKLMSRI